MGRRLRTSVPQTDKFLVPEWPYLKNFREGDKAMREKQKENFDSRHRVKDLPPIPKIQKFGSRPRMSPCKVKSFR